MSCQAYSLEDVPWLARVPSELVAARWLHFLLYEGKQYNVSPQLEAYKARPRNVHKDDEVAWHSALRAVLTVRAC